MAYELTDLVIDRVDLVDEGANSAAFVELYKRKERAPKMTYDEILSKLKPEHAEVVRQEVAKASEGSTELAKRVSELEEQLAKATEDKSAQSMKEMPESGADDAEKACGESDKTEKTADGASFDETETLKSMPAAARKLYAELKQQRDEALAKARQADEKEAERVAIEKARSMKALPVPQDKLVSIIKSSTPDVVELLGSINAALEQTVLDEVGKNAGNGAGKAPTAWEKLEQEAQSIAKARNITNEQAMSQLIKEKPDLYREYLKEGK